MFCLPKTRVQNHTAVKSTTLDSYKKQRKHQLYTDSHVNAEVST